MLRLLLSVIVLLSSCLAFETTNLQLLYSNDFKGDAFIYDTVDGEKTTVTFEHFRTFSYGDLYMFVDVMKGEKFDASKVDVYTEISPRLSFSKLFNADLSLGFIKDIYFATQLNAGYDYEAYLGGLGLDLSIPGFNYFSLNVYYKSENIDDEDTFQISPAYQTQSLYDIHLEGFIDYTGRDFNTQNQLLYRVNTHILLGSEWLYYDYNAHGNRAHTNVFQAMIKYLF
jgi:nucleoside-specific outer membrane channel protein Tsx